MLRYPWWIVNPWHYALSRYRRLVNRSAIKDAKVRQMVDEIEASRQRVERITKSLPEAIAESLSERQDRQNRTQSG